MKFIEALKLKSKLFFLFLLITLGLVAVGVMGTININSMKKKLDSLYFGSLVPVTELNEILQTYHGSIAATFYRAKDLELSPNETFLYIESSLIKIDKLWESYENHFKRENEMEYIEYVSSEMKATNDYFSKLLEAHKAENELKVVNTTSIEKEIAHIDVIIQKLINYEVGVAKFERTKFLQLYNSTILQVGIVLLLIILAVLFISYQVFVSIQKDQTELENVTKKLRGANKKLETVSYTDSLTTLHNRRYFNHVYEREIKRAKRTHSHITFMMLDIDYFKQYNDTYGHIEGDHALKSVAKVLKDTLQRADDFIFRLGGEEFGVLLTQTDAQNSAILAQSLCNAVKDRNIKHETSKASEFLTISIGVVSCIADDALDENILISHADKMLYKAKEGGRNRYVMDSNIGEIKISNDSWSVVEVSAEV
ncbi:MAG: diguanylate cyclase [Campylobacterales bacterium]|nr:diguanylate cyclase [Campylobacterales bacterium]